MSTGRVACGIDLGGTTLRVGLVDESLAVIWRRRAARPSGQPEAVLSELAGMVEGGMKACGVGAGRVAGLGVGMPGLVDCRRGLAGRAVNLPGWEGFPVARYLTDRLGLDVRLDHDVRAVTRAEMLCGAARGVRNFVLVTIGTGIGACIVIEGKIYARSTGDMGHMTIDYGGRRCSCGGSGCLERYVSGRVLERELARAVAHGKSKRPITAPQLVRRARAGEAWAREIFERLGECLGFGILNVAAILNPEVVIIGGGLSRAGRLLTEPAIRVLKERSLVFSSPQRRVVIARLGENAGIIGAASLFLRKWESR